MHQISPRTYLFPLIGRNTLIVQQPIFARPELCASGAPRVALIEDDPATVFTALAPLLAGQARVRISKDGGRSYPLQHERDLTDKAPTMPAAVRIFGKDGTCRALFFDFDSTIAGGDRVDAEVHLFTSWLYRHGLRWIADHSPNGGRHIYIPLQERMPFNEARELVEAVSTRYRTLDKSPHQSIDRGCMRIPGSIHKRGGHQLLDMSLSMAYDIARRPNPAQLIQALRNDLSAEIAAVRALRLEQPYPALEDEGPKLDEPRTRMSRRMLDIAAKGIYDSARYSSPSEARQAVLVAAAAAGLTLTDVDRRIKQGLWPGLAQFFARYSPAHRAAALKRDWAKAVEHVKTNQKLDKRGKDNVRKYPTSQPNTQGQGLVASSIINSDHEHRFIRTWRNALAIAEVRYRGSRQGLARRMVLRALGAAAHMSGSRFIEFGVRSIAVATGMDHTTVAAHLRALRHEPEPLIIQVVQAKGTHADQYMLALPPDLESAAEAMSWRAGKLHALRPAFRELGLPAAFVYEAVEHSPAPLSITQLVEATALSRTAVTEALEILAAWRLVSRGGPDGRGWSIDAAGSLTWLAEYFGVMESVATQIKRYREERAAWRSWLAGRLLEGQPLLSPGDPYPWHLAEQPPDDWELSEIAFSRAG